MNPTTDIRTTVRTDPAARDGDLWAVTSYFNPAGYQRRRDNYRAFRQALEIPLLTVELSFDGSFYLKPHDADILLQLRAGDVMWQKERLLNLASNLLPKHVTKLAWLDCDICFLQAGWSKLASRMLDDRPLVQLYRELLERSEQGGPFDSLDLQLERLCSRRVSLASLIAEHGSSDICFGAPGAARRIGYAPGLAWASRREVLARTGLYDAMIAGGGDKMLVSAAFGHAELAADSYLGSNEHREHYLNWAGRFAPNVAGGIGFVDVPVMHFWHGDYQNRRYASRFVDLAKYRFNPAEDIALSTSGCWRWNSRKPAMHQYIRDYFWQRQEDGTRDSSLREAA